MDIAKTYIGRYKTFRTPLDEDVVRAQAAELLAVNSAIVTFYAQHPQQKQEDRRNIDSALQTLPQHSEGRARESLELAKLHRQIAGRDDKLQMGLDRQAFELRIAHLDEMWWVKLRGARLAVERGDGQAAGLALAEYFHAEDEFQKELVNSHHLAFGGHPPADKEELVNSHHLAFGGHPPADKEEAMALRIAYEADHFQDWGLDLKASDMAAVAAGVMPSANPYGLGGSTAEPFDLELWGRMWDYQQAAREVSRRVFTQRTHQQPSHWDTKLYDLGTQRRVPLRDAAEVVASSTGRAVAEHMSAALRVTKAEDAFANGVLEKKGLRWPDGQDKFALRVFRALVDEEQAHWSAGELRYRETELRRLADAVEGKIKSLSSDRDQKTRDAFLVDSLRYHTRVATTAKARKW